MVGPLTDMAAMLVACGALPGTPKFLTQLEVPVMKATQAHFIFIFNGETGLLGILVIL